MSVRLAVRNITIPTSLSESLFVYCIGFERRSRFLAERLDWSAELSIAIRYSESRVLSFEENNRIALNRGHGIVSDSPGVLEECMQRKLREARSKVGVASIAIDVSSMDRSLMARAMVTALSAVHDGECVYILYAPSTFCPPTRNLVPIRRAGAAHPSLAGEIAAPDTLRVALLGLGYEYGVSLNILETHEPDMSFIFRPNGADERFKGAVSDANFGFDFGERNYDVIDYYLNDMAGAYDDISNLIASTKHDSSIICVPMGPKILSAVMILAGHVHQPRASVLRYSVASMENLQDSTAAEECFGISVMKVKERAPSAGVRRGVSV
jgi:hypothetical protein